MLLTTLVLYCEGCVKRRKHLQKRLSSPKMSVIKLKSNDEKIFEVDIEVTITNAASIWIYKKCDTSYKCHFFAYMFKVAKKSLIVKDLLENGATEGDVSVFYHIELFFLQTFPHWNAALSGRGLGASSQCEGGHLGKGAWVGDQPQGSEIQLGPLFACIESLDMHIIILNNMA